MSAVASTFTTARSRSASSATDRARQLGAVLEGDRDGPPVPPSITWWFVRISPLASNTKPEPTPVDGIESGPNPSRALPISTVIVTTAGLAFSATATTASSAVMVERRVRRGRRPALPAAVAGVEPAPVPSMTPTVTTEARVAVAIEIPRITGEPAPDPHDPDGRRSPVCSGRGGAVGRSDIGLGDPRGQGLVGRRQAVDVVHAAYSSLPR